MHPKKLYASLAVLCLLAYGYVAFSMYKGFRQTTGLHACALRSLTGRPCPTCGTTRAVVAFFEGDFFRAWLENPIGILVGVLMVAVPVLLLYDLLWQRQIVFGLYRKSLEIIGIRWVVVLLLLLFLANWMWNLSKY